MGEILFNYPVTLSLTEKFFLQFRIQPEQQAPSGEGPGEGEEEDSEEEGAAGDPHPRPGVNVIKQFTAVSYVFS